MKRKRLHKLEAAGRHTRAMRKAESDAPHSCLFAGSIKLADLEAKEGQTQLPRFSIEAYHGGYLPVKGYQYPVIVDLATAKFEKEKIQINRAHDRNREVGHTTRQEINAGGIYLEGILSVPGPDRQQVVEAAENGYEWEASIEASFYSPQFIPRGRTIHANGKTFDGPCYYVRNATITGTAILTGGADRSTKVSIAAQEKESLNMDKALQEYIEAQGFDPVEVEKNDAQLQFLTAAHKNTLGTPPTKTQPVADNDFLVRQREAAAAEAERLADIHRICAQYGNPMTKLKDGTEVSLESHAIRTGMDVKEMTLEAKLWELDQKSAGSPFAIHSRTAPEKTPQVLEAALCATIGLDDLEKQFKPETLEAADRHRGLGLQQLILHAASANGYRCGPGERINNGNFMDVLGYAFGRQSLQASGFSTLSLPGILGNVANKSILAGYMEEDQTWREIAEVVPVSNFHLRTRYRLLDDFGYEEVGPDGELKHGKVGQESYTHQAKTYGKMFAITRQNIINDDMGAFNDIRSRLGRGAAQKFNTIFWTTFLDDDAFWTTARGNYIEGSTTNLGLDGVGLKAGVLAFRKMRTPAADGQKRVGSGMTPRKLLVPPELESIADTLYTATNISAVKASDGNIYAKKYRPIVSNYLSDAGITGYSTTAWWLLGDAMMPMVVSFLNGVQAPTVESKDADFSTLGIQMRGYHDWGCDKSEYLSGVKSKGAA